MRSWLVISNCQTLGLANSLALQNPSVVVQPIDSVAYARDKAKLDRQLGKYEFVFVNDQLYGDRPNSFSSAPNVIVVPHIVFDGYHPDLAYVRVENGGYLQSPLGGYHSVICLVAFQAGLSEDEACRLYNATTYEALGYLDDWSASTERLRSDFGRFGYDIEKLIRKWSLRDSFMYSFNHPKIRCLFDLATLASGKAGYTPAVDDMIPNDNLAASAIFPVYAEIAEHLGVPGSYRFKKVGDLRTLDLKQFVAGSFASYRKSGSDRLTASSGPFHARYLAARDWLKA